MKKVNLIQFGIGNIGSELIKQIKENKKKLRKKLRIDLNYACFIKKDCFSADTNGFSNNKLDRILEFRKNKKDISKLDFFQKKLSDEGVLRSIKNKNAGNCIVIDVTASDDMYNLFLLSLKEGFNIVTSNKKPLCVPYNKYKKLINTNKKNGAILKHECTVGAALPIISTLHSLLNTGDKIIGVTGCFSGTLGFIFSELEKGRKFSNIVKEAKDIGYTEPDPRDDLSGIDVARKALILARLKGLMINLEDIRLESLVPKELEKVSVEEFLWGIKSLDKKFESMLKKALNDGLTLRYVAEIKEGSVNIGLKEVPLNSPIGSLKGPGNICVFKTKRYDKNPLVIQGPGAGIEVTAAGVLNDIIEIANQMSSG